MYIYAVIPNIIAMRGHYVFLYIYTRFFFIDTGNLMTIKRPNQISDFYN